jgi:hypothetical protein
MPLTCNDPECMHKPRECWSREKERSRALRVDEDQEPEEEEEQRPPRSDVDPTAALNRAIRRKLTGPGGGDLPRDLTAAVLEAAVEVLGDEGECTIAELNELFGLSWREPDWDLPLHDLKEAIGVAQENLYSEDDLLDFLRCTVASDWNVLGSSPEGTATMMSDDGIGLYDFTVDDGVYFFVLAERDLCDSQWWFAHAVNDMESRSEAIRSAEAAFAMTEDTDDQ